MKNNKLTKEEFDNITELTTKANQLAMHVGSLEAQKMSLLQSFKENDTLIQEQKNKLNEKYGNISIDLKDGSFTENEVVEQDGK
tara:strand:- start:221 stop:472 length:252 start_codon:yes stop_codon:yes gene_type:complete